MKRSLLLLIVFFALGASVFAYVCIHQIRQYTPHTLDQSEWKPVDYKTQVRDLPDGQKQMDVFVGDHYYKDEDSGELKPIDWTLAWDDARKGWFFDTHSFHPFIPEYADEWVDFEDVFEEKDQITSLRAQAGHVRGELVDHIDGLTDLNAVVYADAFGPGIDYIIYFTRSNLKKLVRIDDTAIVRDADMSFEFEVKFPEGVSVQKVHTDEDGKWVEDVDFWHGDTSYNQVMIVRDDDIQNVNNSTFIQFRAWDDDQNIPINISYHSDEEGRLFLKKILPKDFLESAKGTVYTDASVTYYPALDGYVYACCSSWSTSRNATTGGVNKTLNTFTIQAQSSSGYNFFRSFLSFNTAALSSSDIISSAILYLHAASTSGTSKDVVVLKSYQSSPTDLAATDFNDCGAQDSPNSPDEGSSRFTIVSGASNAISLNATGMSWIDPDGYTQLCVRCAIDVDNTPSTCYALIDSSEALGTSIDPKITITYSANSAPTASIGTPSQTDASTVTFTSTIADANSNATTASVEYSLDNSTWYDATLGAVTASDGTVTTSTGSIESIDTNTDGSVDLTIEWNMAADISGTEDSTVYLRITPNDGYTDGSAATSASFEADAAAPSTPGNLSVNTTSTTGVTLNFGAQSSDINFDQYIIYYKAGSSGVTDSDTALTSSTDSNLGSASYGGQSTTQITGLSVNTQYVAKIFAYDTWGNVASSASEQAFYTLANTPGTPTVTASSTTSVVVVVDENSNPAVTTTYAICITTNGTDCASGSSYLQLDGSFDTVADWDTYDSWGGATGVEATGLSINTAYQFLVKARNGDAVETAFSSASSPVYTFANPAGTPTVNNPTATTLDITLDTNSNPSSVVYAIYDSNTDQYVDSGYELQSATGVFRTSSAWDAIVVTGLTPNTQYSFSVIAQNGDEVNAATSSEASAYTLANTPLNPEVNNPTSSTLDINITGSTNSNSASTTYAIYNVTNGTWLDSDGTSSGIEVWQTAAAWATTTATGLSSNASYTYRVKAKNADDVETNLSDPTAAFTATADPSNFQAVIISTSTITFTVDAFENDDVGSAAYCFYVTSCDSGSGWITTSTWQATGLSINTQYTFYAQYRNSSAVESNATELTLYTKAIEPGAPTLSNEATTTIDITIDTNGNSVDTYYAIYNYTDTVYLDVNGNATTTEVWQKNSDWGTATAIGLTPNSTYTFKVKAKNGEGTITNLGDGSSTYTLAAQAGQPVIFSTDTSTISFLFSGSNNPSGTVYTVYNETDSAVFATTTVTSSVSVTSLTPNKSYQFSIITEHNGGGSSAATSSPSSAIATLPIVPTSLAATSASSSQIDLSWSSGNASGSMYDVRYLDGTFIATTTATSYSVTGLSENTEYTFKVRTVYADDDSQYSSYSNTATETTDLDPPIAPTGVTLSSLSTSTLTTSWTDASSNEDSFIVKQGTDGSTYGTTVTTTAADVTTTGVTGLTPNQTYYFIVIASNATATATSTAASTTTLPIAPTSLAATSISSSRIDLSWSSGNASGSMYEVRYLDDTFIVTTTATSYSVTGLSEDTEYTFKVRTVYAGDDATYSAYSSTATETTALNAPDAPTGVAFSSISTSTLTTSWTDASANEDSFIVQYGTDGSTYGTTVTTTAADVTSVNVTGLTPNQTYYVRVIASNTTATATSTAASTTTDPVVPTSVSATANSTSQITVSWSANGNASGTVYELFNVTASTTVATTTDTSYAVTGLSASTAYTFKVRTIYASDDTLATSYTDTVSATTDAASSGSNDGGSGSSGGGTATPAPTKPIGGGVRTDYIGMGAQGTIPLAPGGTNVFMYITSQAYFDIIPSSRIILETHSITVKNLDLFTHVITLRIASDPIEVSLPIGETTYVDLDADGINDLKVTFANLVVNQAEITVVPLVDVSATQHGQGCPVALETAYKSKTKSSVYFVSQAHYEDGRINPNIPCTKRPFESGRKYFTYFTSWDEVEVVSQATLDSIPQDVLGFMPQGPKYDPKYGALVKVVTDPKVYLLLGGNKQWITSEAVFTALNYSWNWIEDVAETLLSKYQSKGEINYTDHHPNYTLIKHENDPKVYRLEPHPEDTTKQVKRHIVDEETFESLNFRWDRIVTIPDTEVYETGEPLGSSSVAKGIQKQVLAHEVAPPAYTFTLFLSAGSSGPEVQKLQEVLQATGFLDQQVKVNGYYGVATTEAVTALQRHYGIDPVGYVGPSTRSILNTLQ